MKHYVLIDEHSGYVWGSATAKNAIEACRKVDETIGEHGRQYDDIGGAHLNGRSGYHVYEAPEEFAEVGDGQDPAYIDMVAAFPFVTRIATVSMAEG